MYKRIIFLRDSSANIPASGKLTELLQYESRIKNCSYRLDSTRVLLLQRIGAAYAALGNFINAVKFTEQSINIIHSNTPQPAVNRLCLLKNYSNLNIFYDSLNDFQRKRMANDSCIAIGRTLRAVKEPYLKALVNKVEDLYYAGDYSFCFNYASIGEEATKKYDNFNREDYYRVFVEWKINTLIKDKKYALAEQHLLARLKDFTNPGVEDYRGTIYELLAEVMIYNKNSSKALVYFQQAINYDKRTGNMLGCVQTLNNLGYLYYFKYLGDHKKALLSCKQALKYSNKNVTGDDEKWESSNIHANIANIYIKEALYDQAFQYFQLAFDQLQPGLNEKTLSDSLVGSFLKNGNSKYLTELLIDKADAFLARYHDNRNANDLKEGIHLYKLVDRLLDKIKTGHIEVTSKLSWRENSRRLYEHAIEACYQDNRVTDAFYFLEKSRAVLLSDQLNELNLISQNDIFNETQLKKNIISKEAILKSIHKSDASYMQLFSGIVDSKQKLFELQQAIKIRNPLYYQQFIDSSFITLRDVQQKILKDPKALIEMYTGDSAVYVMIIQPGEINLTRIDKTAYDSAVNLFINYISNAGLLNKNFNDFVKISKYLYTLIFKNIPLPAGRIIISPDGLNFPFEALLIDKENNSTEYLLNKYAISYTYSGRYLLNQFNSASQTGAPDLLGIAPIEYPPHWNLASLRDCDLSLKRIQNYFRHADIQLFEAATKNNFMNDFTKYTIIQLYTHASDSGSPGEPVIYFADSVLYLSELVGGEKPVTNLVVLSACNTGTGKLHLGEGIFSFNRGFAAIGIPASITNLWAVDKASVLQLTELFYKYLNQGLPTDVALQQAKLEFLHVASERGKLPFYWAGTILAGKANTIESKRPFPWQTIFISVGCILITLLAYRRIIHNKRSTFDLKLRGMIK